VGVAPHAVVIDDQYVVFEKNTVHKGEGAVCLGNGAYSHEDKVLNNEIYSMVLQRSDVGTIYNRDGRIVGDRVIDGNYIHDFKPLNEHLQSSEHQYAIGIYMDDCCSGAEITNNVLFNGAGSGIQIGGGQNHLIEGNVIADMGKTPILTDNRGETWSAWADNPIVPSGNAIINNVSDVELSISSRMAVLGTVSGNVTESFDISRYMNLIDKAGCSIQPITKLYNLRGFNKHGAVSTSDGLLLTWEPTVMADEFCVVVAEDEQMENVVLEATVPYNYLLTDIPIGSYYWKVTAVNKGNSTGDNWGCSDGVGEFVIE